MNAFGLLLCVSIFSAALAAVDLSSYSLSQELREGYELYWSFDVEAETIRFAVRVSTTGWVGLGLSPNGGMPNSDIVIGWVNDQGEAFLHDRYATAEERPPVDAQQDWILDGGDENNGYTVLAFRRNWVTCDTEQDRDIKVETARIIFSWNDADPVDDDPSRVAYHGTENRGSVSLNLLGLEQELPPQPDDVQLLNITVDNVRVPTDDTTYWCSVFELPAEIQARKHYITRISPIITEGNEAVVHHIVVTECYNLNDTHVGESGVCRGAVSEPVTRCRGGVTIFAWAVGGTDFYFPDNVSYPIGGGGPPYIVMETHYDNPAMSSTINDSSGLTFFYTETAPVYEAGILSLGFATLPTHIIPPGAQNFNTFGDCAPECTRDFLPSTGITVFSNFLHTHLAGHGVTLRHYRQTSDEDTCSALEELPPIEQNPAYDFDFQQYTTLPQPVTVLPGDTLRVECNYRTMDRNEPTFGGPATADEMCLTFAAYYPRVPLSSCFSLPNTFSPAYLQNFLAKHVSEDIANQIRQAGPINSGSIRSAWNQVTWTPEAIADFEDAHINGPLLDICLPENTTISDLASISMAPTYLRNEIQQPDCTYEAPNQCTGFEPMDCCSRLDGSGGAAVFTSSLMLIALCLIAVGLF